jgi:hypothetical protein
MVYPDLVELLGSVTDPASFLAENALHDKIEIALSGVGLYGGDYDNRGMLETIYRYGQTAANSGEPGSNGGFFRQPQFRPGGLNRIAFWARGDHYTTSPGRPLIGGEIVIKRDGGARSHSSSAYRLGARLSVNPTRTLRHHLDGSIRARVLRGQRLEHPSLLLSRRKARNDQGEHILDDNDNCMLNARQLRLCTPAVHHALRDLCVRSAVDFITGAIANCVGAHSALRGTWEYSLVSCETYWERACENPIQYVRWLAEQFLAETNRFHLRIHPRPTSLGREGNSLSISKTLVKGLELKVYAKTNRRIRFEVRHDLRTQASILGGGHITNNLDELCSWLSLAAEDAAHKLGRITTSFQPATDTLDIELLMAFFSKLDAAPGEYADIERILSVLIGLGGYAGRDPQSVPILDHLERAGVLELTGRGVRSVTTTYRPIVERLRHSLWNEQRSADPN